MKIKLLSLVLSTIVTMSGINALAATTVPDVTTEAKQAEAKTPYISKQPRNGVFNVVVLGDSLADGLYSGLYRLNRDSKNLKFTKASKVNTGLVRSDRYDWNRGAAKIARSGKYEVAVVLLGLNDLQTFRTKGKRQHFSQPDWEVTYKERLSKVITDLKSGGMAVYWVGIPITTPKRYQKEYAYLNGFFKEAAKEQGIRYVDTWSGLADANGKYSAFWKSPDGKQKKIRMRDGVHFTPDGYMIFASFMNDILQKDLAEVLPQQASQSE